MRRILFFYGFLILGFNVYAQKKTLTSSSDTTKHFISVLKADSVAGHFGTHASRQRKKMIQIADTLTLTDYIMSIERVNYNLNEIRDSAQLGFEAVRLEREIDDITGDIVVTRQNVRAKHSSVNIKNIYLYQSLTAGLDNDNTRIRARVNQLYKRTYRARLHLKTVFADSIFRILLTEKDVPDALDMKLTRLNRKWARTDSIVKANINIINVLKVNTADNAMNLTNMLYIMDKKLDIAKPQLFGLEVEHLWHLGKTDSTTSDPTKTINLLSSEDEAIAYYLTETAGKREVLLLLGVLLFVWLFFKRKLLKVIKEKNDIYHYLHIHYLNNHSIFSLAVILLCLMPLLDAYAPIAYIAIVYTLLLAAASVIFFRQNKRSALYYWFALVILFIADTLTYLLIEPTWIARVWMLAIHVAIFVFSYGFYKQLTQQTPYYKWIKRAILTGMTLMVLAVICNLFGRFSLSGILGLSGIFAITQVLILPIFIDTIIEIIVVQLLSSRLRKGVQSPFDCSVVGNKIRKPLIWVSVILWVIMLTSNLNIYHEISNYTVESLTAMRKIGSISFEWISVLLFFVIIWSAHILQRILIYIFGETGSESEDVTTVTKSQHSRLLITRLLILIAGYFIAIAASGLPIDKLTFLLGALGVGIGLGLQSIVNNFVSGIILIFDGTLKIGDEIEVNGQAGRVKEIGLRASTLHTAEGAEVIIPNGSILSQNIVNWTFSNDQKRVTLTFNLMGKELDANMVNEVINTTIGNIANIITKRAPVILYTKVTSESLSLTVRCWSTIGNVDQVKSEAMLQLSAAFTAKNIGFE